MVGILHGEFVKSREPSDRAEEQGSYGKPIFKFTFRGNRVVGSKPTRVVGSLVNTHFRVQRFEGAEESDSGEWTGGILVDTEVRPSLTILGFRGLKN
jgi:hypothetical protein